MDKVETHGCRAQTGETAVSDGGRFKRQAAEGPSLGLACPLPLVAPSPAAGVLKAPIPLPMSTSALNRFIAECDASAVSTLILMFSHQYFPMCSSVLPETKDGFCQFDEKFNIQG